MGEIAMREANCPDFMTVAVAPHQVYVPSPTPFCFLNRIPLSLPKQLHVDRYGPRDNLFLPNILEAAGTGRIRIFGPGTNRYNYSIANALVVCI